MLAFLYVVSPIDALPDFLIDLGEIGDGGVDGLTLLALTGLVPG